MNAPLPPLETILEQLNLLQRTMEAFAAHPDIHERLEQTYLCHLAQLRHKTHSHLIGQYENWYKRHMGVEDV